MLKTAGTHPELIGFAEPLGALGGSLGAGEGDDDDDEYGAK